MNKELWLDIKIMAWSYSGVLLFAGLLILQSPKMPGLLGEQVYIILQSCSNNLGMCPLR